MVCAWSRSFWRTIIGWLQQSLWWWPPHPLFCITLTTSQPVRLILDFRQNSYSTPLPPENHHSYHCHCQPAPCTTYRSVTTLFLLLLLLWTFELYLILSYRYEDILISWSYLLILSLDLRSYLDLLILSSDDDPRYVSLYELYIYYLHACDMLLTHVFHWRSTCILHMLLCNMLLPYSWHALDTHFTCVYLEDNTWTLVYKL